MNVSLHGAVEHNLAQAPKAVLRNEFTSIQPAKSFPSNVARMQAKQGKKEQANKQGKTSKTTKISPDFNCHSYDTLRASVNEILSVSSKFELKVSRSKGVVLQCGSNDPNANEEGLGTCIVPLKTTKQGPGGTFMLVDNPIVQVLGAYARSHGQETSDDLPELVLGLCCNNWGMYHGRNALIEALLEVMGDANSHKLSIHSALYALDFNAQALSHILPSTDEGEDTQSSEQNVRNLHAAAFRASAAKYSIGLDTIEKETERFEGVSKAGFVEELSEAVTHAVERTMASNGKAVLSLVLEILRLRRLIQDNLANRKFRRAPSQNCIARAIKQLTQLLAQNFSCPDLALAQQVPGWEEYTQSVGGAAEATLGLYCHSIDVLAGGIARYLRGNKVEVTPDLAERLVLTVLEKDNRLLEYCFNQVYELQPDGCTPSRMYLYRRFGDLSQFSTMPCGAVELGAKV